MAESSENHVVLSDAETCLEQMPDWFPSISVVDHPDRLTRDERQLLCNSDFFVQRVGTDQVTLGKMNHGFFEFVAVAKREGREVTMVNNTRFRGGAPKVALETDSDFRMLFRHPPGDAAPDPDVQ